ncbi:hypothetical protein PLESTB_000762700 [Pleodorina starrii]|uniref:SprT-like domain-containing protein n=1 Tax=Pleodorina starrii TaxID=330485 RepID=A0A9W6BKJ6_9CHLO|nr:hypothetical protein PLESTM_001578400 [Pleodorina starrii]GLC53558.1 hypothetical protein PLESTB_000762700 [Pleodorina starrii]
MVLTWSLPRAESERTSSKTQYDFRLDEQDWEKVCWGRLPKGQARAPAHQLSRRAKWAAVLRAASTPEGGSWRSDFQPEDLTPARLQALARLIDREFFQGTFHREVSRRAGRHLAYCAGDIDQLHGDGVPRGDAVMSVTEAAAAPPPPPSAQGGCCTDAVATAATASTSSLAAAGPLQLHRPHHALHFHDRDQHQHQHRHQHQRYQQRHRYLAGGDGSAADSSRERPTWGAQLASSGASFPSFPSARSRCDCDPNSSVSSSSRSNMGGGAAATAGAGDGGGGGDGGSGGGGGRWGWLRGLWRRRRQGRGDGGGGGRGSTAAAGGGGGAAAASAAIVVAPSATYQHSRTSITFWRQVWASYSPSVGSPMRLDGVPCNSRLSWLAHTLGHEMLHALLFNMCGAYARDAPKNLSMEGHGYNFLMLNWYVLGHRGYSYNPRGWTLPPPLPCRL